MTNKAPEVLSIYEFSDDGETAYYTNDPEAIGVEQYCRVTLDDFNRLKRVAQLMITLSNAVNEDDHIFRTYREQYEEVDKLLLKLRASGILEGM